MLPEVGDSNRVVVPAALSAMPLAFRLKETEPTDSKIPVGVMRKVAWPMLMVIASGVMVIEPAAPGMALTMLADCGPSCNLEPVVGMPVLSTAPVVPRVRREPLASGALGTAANLTAGVTPSAMTAMEPEREGVRVSLIVESK